MLYPRGRASCPFLEIELSRQIQMHGEFGSFSANRQCTFELYMDFVGMHRDQSRNDPQRWGGINNKTEKVIYVIYFLKLSANGSSLSALPSQNCQYSIWLGLSLAGKGCGSLKDRESEWRPLSSGSRFLFSSKKSLETRQGTGRMFITGQRLKEKV